MEDASQSANIAVPDAQPRPKGFWRDFGFEPEGEEFFNMRCALPSGVIAFSANTDNLQPLIRMAGSMGHPTLSIVAGKRRYEVYRVFSGFDPMSAQVPEGITLHGSGESISLPDGNDFKPEQYRLRAIGELPLLTVDDLAQGLELKGYFPVVDSPLAKHSLRGRSEEFEKMAVKAEPLLGEIAMSGQATVLYAPPNAGKTLMVLSLLVEAVEQKRINPGNVYYINADDSSDGFATKLGLMDDLGVHTLAPGYGGFEAAQLVERFHGIANDDKAKGTLVIIDTIKKYTTLMDKGKATEFTNACRLFVMKGGSIVGLAHTNKTPSSSGKLQYSGTTDVKDDFDAAYIITPTEMEGVVGEKMVSFECIKARGPNARNVTYAYAETAGASYLERLASVRLLTAQEMDGFRRVEAEKADSEIVAAIEGCIRTGDFAKMALAKEAARQAGVSSRAAMRVVEAYTGTDPSIHKWTFVRKDRGAMIFTLLSEPEEELEPLAA